MANHNGHAVFRSRPEADCAPPLANLSSKTTRPNEKLASRPLFRPPTEQPWPRHCRPYTGNAFSKAVTVYSGKRLARGIFAMRREAAYGLAQSLSVPAQATTRSKTPKLAFHLQTLKNRTKKCDASQIEYRGYHLS